MRRLARVLAPLALAACAAPRAASAPSALTASPAPSAAPVAAVAPSRKLPDGWRAPELAAAGHSVALRIESEPLDVASLPVLALTHRIDPGFHLRAIEPLPAHIAGPKAVEVRTFGTRVTIAGHRFGGVAVGVGQMPFFDFTEGGTGLRNVHGFTDLSWTSFDGADDGALDVEIVHGFYDADKKQGVESQHHRVHAAPIAGGTYFAFRTSCPACEVGEQERLHLVGPGTVANLDGDARREPAAGALVSYVSLPLDAGTAGGTSAFLSATDVVAWGNRVGLPIERPTRVPVGFYASRGSADASPLVVVRMSNRP